MEIGKHWGNPPVMLAFPVYLLVAEKYTWRRYHGIKLSCISSIDMASLNSYPQSYFVFMRISKPSILLQSFKLSINVDQQRQVE